MQRKFLNNFEMKNHAVTFIENEKNAKQFLKVSG